MGEELHPTTEHLLALAKKYGIKKGSAIIEEVREATTKWQEFAKVAGVSQNSIESIDKIIKEQK